MAPEGTAATTPPINIRSTKPYNCEGINACARVGENLPPPPVFLPTNGDNAGTPRTITPPTAADIDDFVRRINNAWCVPYVEGNSISNTFSPDLSGLQDLDALANLGGFDHFNIEQDITDISQNDFPTRLSRWTGVDPAVGGNSFVQFDDEFPWYYNEVFKPGEWMPMYNNPGIYASNASGQHTALKWGDAPNMGPKNAGVTLTFVDYIVGVNPDHTGVRISQAFPNAEGTNFQWTLRQGVWGAKRHDRISASDFIEPGSKGSVRFLGYFGSDSSARSPAPANACKAALQSGRFLPAKPSFKKSR